MKALDVAIPLGRLAEPSEFAELGVFLASGVAGYMTATTVVIDGGIMPGSVACESQHARCAASSR